MHRNGVRPSARPPVRLSAVPPFRHGHSAPTVPPFPPAPLYYGPMNSHSPHIPYLPARIEGLAPLAKNLWWSWNREARGLFRSIDAPLWGLTRHNPLELLCRVDPERIAACASDSDFLRRYDEVMARLHHETSSRDTWFTHNYGDLDGRPVAY